VTEPTSTTATTSLLFAALGAALGPLLAEWALILIGGFVGSFLAVSLLPTPTIRSAARVLATGIGMAMLFTGVAAYLLSAMAPATMKLSTDLLLLPVAGFIGWQQQRVLDWIKPVWPFGGKKESP
jgi:hypothetical protein